MSSGVARMAWTYPAARRQATGFVLMRRIATTVPMASESARAMREIQMVDQMPRANSGRYWATTL